MTTSTGRLERALVLVDGQNLGAQQNALGARAELRRLRYWALAYGWAEVHWFQGDYPQVAPIFAILQESGVTVHTRRPKRGARGLEANMDTDLAVFGAARMAEGDIATLVLVSGDGDFAPLLAEARRRGVRTVVVSEPDHLSADLAALVEPHDLVTVRDLVIGTGGWWDGRAA